MTATILNTANSELQNEYDDDAELQAAIDAKYCKQHFCNIQLKKKTHTRNKTYFDLNQKDRVTDSSHVFKRGFFITAFTY